VCGLGGKTPHFGMTLASRDALGRFLVELLRHGCGTAHVTEAHHVYMDGYLALAYGDEVVQLDFTRRLGRLLVHQHPPLAHLIGSQAAGLVEACCPKPLVEPEFFAHGVLQCAVLYMRARMRTTLTMAAARPNITANHTATTEPCAAESPKASATSAIPRLWPKVRVVACTPPAAPLRFSGTAVNMARLLGDWKNPNPTPPSAMQETIQASPASCGRKSNATSPSTMAPAPMPLSTAAEYRSARRPATGAMKAPQI